MRRSLRIPGRHIQRCWELKRCVPHGLKFIDEFRVDSRIIETCSGNEGIETAKEKDSAS